MASKAETSQRYTVIESGEGREKLLGSVALDAAGIIKVLSEADPAADGPLARIAEHINAKATMQVDAPPPPGSPRFTMAARIVERGTPDFIPALRAYLRTYYHLELRPQ